MMLTLDNLAHRYNCLPSYALANASTLDLHVLDVSAKWSKYQNDKAEGKNSANLNPSLSVEQMQNMINRVRSDK